MCNDYCWSSPVVVEEGSRATLFTTLESFSMVAQLPVIFMGIIKTTLGSSKGLNQLSCAGLES